MRYTLGQGYKTARNHAICDGPLIVAKVISLGYPIGEGWSPDSEDHARKICSALNAAEGWDEEQPINA